MTKKKHPSDRLERRLVNFRYKKEPKMRIIETTISDANVKAQVAAFLYSVGLVNDDEEVVNIEFPEGISEGAVPIKISIKKEDVNG